VQIDSLALRMRPRAPLEAADLGVRFCQSTAREVYVCHVAVAAPVLALSLATFEIGHWLPTLVIWWSKPWLDRTILFVLSRAAFGQATGLSDVWQAQRRVWWSQLLAALTLRRLSPWRSFTQPVHQLEGLPLMKIRQRVLQIRRGHTRSAFIMTSVFSTAESLLTVAAVSLVFWFMPGHLSAQSLLSEYTSRLGELPTVISYAAVVLFLEPFYVAAGFAMYLNRRAQLEAWDIEQELRRAFAE
jgi:hypothetical protein